MATKSSETKQTGTKGNRTDNSGSDTKRDMHVPLTDEQKPLLEAVTKQWTLFQKAGKKSFDEVVTLGEALHKLKGAVQNGAEEADTWKNFIERVQSKGTLHFGLRQANRYIAIYEEQGEYEDGKIGFSFNKTTGKDGNAKPPFRISCGERGKQGWRGDVECTDNGRFRLCWQDKTLVSGTKKNQNITKVAIEAGKMAFTAAISSGKMNIAKEMLDLIMVKKQMVDSPKPEGLDISFTDPQEGADAASQEVVEMGV